MQHYSQGKSTRQAHKAIPEGHFEEEQGLKGFFGPVSHLIRKKPSTRWTNIEGDLLPRMFDLVQLNSATAKHRLFYNNHLNIFMQYVQPQESKSLRAFRSADGDLMYFCHKGSGSIWTEYGTLQYKPGQYIIIPKCIAHVFHAKDLTQFFVVENITSHYEEPDRGIVGKNALYDANTIQRPDLDQLHQEQKASGQEVLEIEVKHGGQHTLYTYDSCAFDVVGWKGDLYPYCLHMDDIMPLMSHRSHLPPSAHTTFVARDFVICSFLPRPLEEDADALKVPFYHQNIDYDEVLFYHDGDFFSRDNLHAGMLSYHPAGFPHGPHPKAMEAAKKKTHTDEYAVMLDSRWPLQRDGSLDSVEVKNYWQSWMK